MTRHPSIRTFSSFLTIALLLAALPTAALAGGGGLGLDLDETPVARSVAHLDVAIGETGDDAALEPSSAATPTVELARLLPATRLDPAIAVQQTQRPPDVAPKEKRGFGRWLKKHWYVPVLVGAAIGVAVAASGGDDDSTGEDD